MILKEMFTVFQKETLKFQMVILIKMYYKIKEG